MFVPESENLSTINTDSSESDIKIKDEEIVIRAKAQKLDGPIIVSREN